MYQVDEADFRNLKDQRMHHVTTSPHSDPNFLERP